MQPLRRVFGMEALTSYIDIWSPEYVIQPKAASERSLEPIIRAPI